jgi:serine protease inhibitor
MSSWVHDKTHGKPKPQFNISRNAVMVLINTVYADGQWPEPFEKGLTTTRTFHRTNGDAPVPMMSQSERMLIAEGDTWTRLDQKFDNQGELKIVLPKEDSQLDALAKNPDALRTAFSADSSEAQVNLKLPRFTIDNHFTSPATIRAMQQLGIRQASGDNADFTAMTQDKSSVSISEIIKGTEIAVNEGRRRIRSIHQNQHASDSTGTTQA